MNRVGVMAVHYGKEYIAWAAGSLATACDEVHVFYTPTPSFGFNEGAQCPDTEEELMSETKRFVGSQLKWHRLERVSNEGQHRYIMLDTVERAVGKNTLVAVADADEVWHPSTLEFSLKFVEGASCAGRWLARFHNFWRSWEWTVRDSFRPVRIVDLRHPLHVDSYLDEQMQPHPIYHFGYAQTLATMRYKFTCHGHKAEFKPGWFDKKFLPWTPNGDHEDLHPCVNNLWTAEQTDGDTLAVLDQLLTDHPHQHLKVIS
jgi:hypothetical protein